MRIVTPFRLRPGPAPAVRCENCQKSFIPTHSAHKLCARCFGFSRLARASEAFAAIYGQGKP